MYLNQSAVSVLWQRRYGTLVHPHSPFVGFLQPEGRLGAAIVVILVDVEDFLPRARQSSSSAASVRSRLPAAVK
jgi:hypothetical protein